ncbi:hypothetical protein SAMN02927921_01826 [Sinomicrobium oceani]|uniref:HEPN domain-containing protein n=1 Tax=Sinomicrobium oceani TaxID=1150368 RepID=A0A1K1PLX1_9FLAO|nr:hypothetical protein [Sinomicrobium oceani]SFW47718.1 hypothetical protein SAMN02927921_01826 [Sinomicrobium oceani]
MEDKMIKQLVSENDAEYIYTTFWNTGKDIRRLVLLLYARKTSAEAGEVPRINEEDNMLFLAYPLPYARKQLHEGNLFFMRMCRKINLVYKKEGQPEEPPSETVDTEQGLRKGRNHFALTYTKMKALHDGVNFYSARKDYEQAVFMLYQAFDIAFGLAGRLLTGKAQHGIRIDEYQRYTGRFYTALGSLFRMEKPEDRKLVKLLDLARQGMTFEEGSQVTETDLTNLEEKYNRLQLMLPDIFDAGIKECQDISGPIAGNSRKKPLKTRDLTDDEKDRMKEKIETLIRKKFYKYKYRPEIYYHKGLRMSCPSEVLFSVASIIKVCVMALDYPENDASGFVAQPCLDIKVALEFAVQLLPYDEMECFNDIVEKYMEGNMPVA